MDHITNLENFLQLILNNSEITFRGWQSYYVDVYTLCTMHKEKELIKTLDVLKGKPLTMEQYIKIRNAYAYLQRIGAYHFDYDTITK